jgi:hypothetical protein
VIDNLLISVEKGIAALAQQINDTKMLANKTGFSKPEEQVDTKTNDLTRSIEEMHRSEAHDKLNYMLARLEEDLRISNETLRRYI